MRPLSYSQINRYLSCPLWYKLQYIDKQKPKERFYLSFGDVIHQCAEYFFKVPVPPPPALDKIYRFYDKIWLSEGYESPEQEQQYKEYGRQLLAEFHAQHAANFRMPLAVEHQFYVNINGIILGGKIDRVDKMGDGVSIVDYKTSKELFTADHLEQDLQLTFYQLAIESTWKMPVKKLTLYHLRSNTPCNCEARTPERIEEARQLVLRVADGIKNAEFPAIENSLCGFCDFPEQCPYHKHEYDLQKGTDTVSRETLQDQDVKEVIEKYAGLQDQKKELETQLDELKQRLCAYCDKGGYKRIYGPDHAISYKTVERSGFDEDKVKAILEPQGLWTKVLKFDPAQLKAFLDESSIDPALKRSIEALKETISSYPQLWVKKLMEEKTED